jgi:hypothetical protein
LVNVLLTLSIKVNIPTAAESQLRNGVTTMKKIKTGRGFWDWLGGHGWGGGGNQA